MVSVTEELVLLALHDATGRTKVEYVDLVLAGGLLVDLVLARRVEIRDYKVVVTDDAPVGHQLLDKALHRLSSAKPRDPRSAVELLHHNGLHNKVAQSLVERRVLRHEADRLVGVIPWNRYLPEDPRVKIEARARLEALVSWGAVDVRTAALAGLVYAGGMERRALPGHPRRKVRRQLKSISMAVSLNSASAAVPSAGGRAVESEQAAATWAIAQATVAAINATSGAGGGE